MSNYQSVRCKAVRGEHFLQNPSNMTLNDLRMISEGTVAPFDVPDTRNQKTIDGMT